MIAESGLADVDAPPICITASLKRSAGPYALIRIAISQHTAPRQRDTYITRNRNFGVGQALLFHQCIKPCGVGRFKPHAAVRGWAADPAGVEVAVDRVA